MREPRSVPPVWPTRDGALRRLVPRLLGLGLLALALNGGTPARADDALPDAVRGALRQALEAQAPFPDGRPGFPGLGSARGGGPRPQAPHGSPGAQGSSAQGRGNPQGSSAQGRGNPQGSSAQGRGGNPQGRSGGVHQLLRAERLEALIHRSAAHLARTGQGAVQPRGDVPPPQGRPGEGPPLPGGGGDDFPRRDAARTRSGGSPGGPPPGGMSGGMTSGGSGPGRPGGH